MSTSSVRVDPALLEGCRSALNKQYGIQHTNAQVVRAGLGALGASLQGDLIPRELVPEIIRQHLDARLPAVVASGMQVVATKLGLPLTFAITEDGRVVCTPSDGGQPMVLEPMPKPIEGMEA